MAVHAIARHALERGDRIAFVHCGRAVRYRECAEAVAALAGHFSRAGIGPGGVAVVCVTSLLDCWLMLLALRACGAVTLAAPGLSAARDPRLGEHGWIVTSAAEPLTEAPVLAAERGWAWLEVPHEFDGAPWSVEMLLAANQGGHLLMTSGTTGAYRLVFRSADGQHVRTEHHRATFGTEENTWQYFGALGPWAAGGFNRAMTLFEFGGTCVFEQRQGCAAAFLDHPVTDAKVTVAGLREFIDSLPSTLARRDELRLDVIGGAAPWALVEQVRERLTRRVYNNLGSTEAGGIATTLLEKPGDQQCYSVLPWRDVAVVDDADQPVAQGQIGRLRIKLMEGDSHEYFGEPEFSRAFFRNGYFYPGDLALFGTDGRLTLQGRASDVIALRGADKIATGPLEQEIATLLGASGACLLATPNAARGDDDFHLVIESAGAITREALAAAVALLPLPGSTVHVHVMKEAPRNAMGKLDRVALRAVAAQALAGG